MPSRGMWRYIPEDGILHIHRRENLKSKKIMSELTVILITAFPFLTHTLYILVVIPLLYTSITQKKNHESTNFHPY
jgi:hypothetical protein